MVYVGKPNGFVVGGTGQRDDAQGCAVNGRSPSELMSIVYDDGDKGVNIKTANRTSGTDVAGSFLGARPHSQKRGEVMSLTMNILNCPDPPDRYAELGKVVFTAIAQRELGESENMLEIQGNIFQKMSTSLKK